MIYKACLTSGKSFYRYPKPTLLYQREEQELSLYKVKDDESANAISTEKEADLLQQLHTKQTEIHNKFSQ